MEERKGSINIKKPEVTILSRVLADNTIYIIPTFQRYYSWEIDNCEELLDDIVNSCRKDQAYFIGFFMYYNEGAADGNESRKVLIDGQQRLTTLMLLLCAIREVTDSNSLKNDINHFIRNSNEKLGKFKLKQNNNDDIYFNDVLDGTTDKMPNNSLIKKNYSWFVDNLPTKTNGVKLSKLVDTIKKLESVEIILNTEIINNVQSIFEKINSTGVGLSESALVRNFVLFTSSIDQQNKLYKIWCCIENIVGQKKVEKFIRAYTIRYNYVVVNKKEVYAKFKEKFENYDKEKILKDMLKYAIYYSIIENHKYYKYDDNYNEIEINKNNEYIDNTLRLLNSLGTDDVVPLMMQLYSKLYDDKKRNKRKMLSLLLELVLEYMIRYRIVKPSHGGGSLDNKFYGIMKKIENNECKLTFNGLYVELSSGGEKTEFPNNTRFIDHMRKDMDKGTGRVLLFQYARKKKKEISDGYIFNDKLTLEHLMPQTIAEDEDNGKWWIKNLGKNYEEIRENYTECVGNYGLLSRELNSDVSNGPWPAKREEILKNAIDETTVEAAKSTTWKKENIEKRNNDLSKEIAKYITGPKREYKKSYKWLKSK